MTPACAACVHGLPAAYWRSRYAAAAREIERLLDGSARAADLAEMEDLRAQFHHALARLGAAGFAGAPTRETAS